MCSQRSHKQARTKFGAGVSDENMLHFSADRGLGSGSKLGTDYERKKNKLQPLATGLMIGVSEEENKLIAATKKEKYKAELLKQINENKRNKVREKTLEETVGATGATKKDLHKKLPEQETQKNPSRSSQEDFKEPLMKCSGLETGAPRDEALLDHSSETSHRNLSQGLGDMAVPRVAGLDPVVCPLCYTPLHASHPFYGTLAYAPPHHHYGTPAYAPPHHIYGTLAYAPPPHYNGTQVHPLDPPDGASYPLEPTLPDNQGK
ncbi:centrosome and spindle pole-associated protein 1-like [Gouania willdenowi]|uniref:centrosome and spindle pole-associated protein 1-like n=1 Tax=Gouania willdenowi TaxID=441366 RepID=UPI0010554323|nr:centrosome and spindle pole-associated protein 1-like [Gouania willdenowi]